VKLLITLKQSVSYGKAAFDGGAAETLPAHYIFFYTGLREGWEAASFC